MLCLVIVNLFQTVGVLWSFLFVDRLSANIMSSTVYKLKYYFSFSSVASCFGTEEQRVQCQAHNAASLPQPTSAERAAHAPECHLPRILHSGKHCSFPSFSGKRLPKFTRKRQQHHLPSLAIQLRSGKSVPAAW